MLNGESGEDDKEEVIESFLKSVQSDVVPYHKRLINELFSRIIEDKEENEYWELPDEARWKIDALRDF